LFSLRRVRFRGFICILTIVAGCVVRPCGAT